MREHKVVNREAYLLSRCAGRTVLHLGCADWPYTEERLRTGSMLHQKLLTVTERCVGFDLESQAVEMMRQKGLTDLVVGNAEVPLSSFFDKSFDIIVAGEIIEHVYNAGLFLESLMSIMHNATVSLITTPNYASVKKLSRLPLGKEIVHPDHVAYYSPKTLNRLCKGVGLNVIDIKYYNVTPQPASRIPNTIIQFFPGLFRMSDGLCVAVTK